jgi:hypothetical protein
LHDVLFSKNLILRTFDAENPPKLRLIFPAPKNTAATTQVHPPKSCQVLKVGQKAIFTNFGLCSSLRNVRHKLELHRPIFAQAALSTVNR